ncbi:putative helicase mov-10-B.1 [Pectinophora gossypiella]|uniref:putative helicase mov-10-B.1 n=1 Tax=Pectinophora gossypiella TaxID=13191 RepID=UPI00214E77EF|nr:putative helicase mov-10-B.1 [Pectinophora gossypiella]XP_049877514.1 putative helicase mov-10-B.1 [Pectinophora gossypiella]XP_049877515.1 putative helicase mov-10-B.1 [Pectinophora gossypiella]
MYCEFCGDVDDHYDENGEISHYASPKHMCNVILKHYNDNKKFFGSNKEGIFIFCNAESKKKEDAPITKIENTDRRKIRVNAQPNQRVKFSFLLRNEMRNDDVLIVGIQLAHPQPQFFIRDHPYEFGGEPHVLKTKSSIENAVSINFRAADIGQFEMPIMFTFHRPRDKKNIIFVREMVINVQECIIVIKPPRNPFANAYMSRAKEFIKCTEHIPYEVNFKIPKLLKILLPGGLNEDAIDKLIVEQSVREELRLILNSTRAIFEEGITEDNYRMYFHYLLWWEEIITRINLRKYNMSDVTIDLREDLTYWLEVPGLAEKRPSLLRGDRVFIRPNENLDILFESIIGNIKENSIQLCKLDERFEKYYNQDALYNIRFLMSRIPMERMHAAVSRVFDPANQGCRIFPKPVSKPIAVQPISKFYNKVIRDNDEQRSAVEHVVSKTSGLAPYIVFGPPGTGKTMTIVEAIIQIVVKNPKHRVLVCTDSNMAADHIALMLLKYNEELNINKFILRANSQNREWSIMPPELVAVSNGSSYDTFYTVTNDYASMYHILVTTLLHCAKFANDSNQSKCKLQMSHVFVDEAAQAKEPAALVPITGLLAPRGQLVLAGDPQQLGPVCISREAAKRGLGESLLERLWNTYKNLYDDNPNYITTLVQNFRSDPDILHIPNSLFYTDKPLQPKAKPDPLSKVSILGLMGGDRAVVFHSVNSREQRMGNAPSYFNEKELLMLQRYMRALVNDHGVSPSDIGIIAPYIRQVYKMRDWLKQNSYEEVEIGTVESFQGKEKRVVLVSTVRANCRLLDYDAKYGLGFLVDDKRFNVALTRAKAKLIIVGNPACLIRDVKWRMYMEYCRDLNCYFGQETEQLQRSAALLSQVARTNFERCRLSEFLDHAIKKNDENKKKRENAVF